MKTRLSQREKQIAELVTWGASAKEISLILTLSSNTVLRHIKNIKKKLGVNKITEVAAYIFCTEYNVSTEFDIVGNIKKIVSVCICLFLVGLVEIQQIDCFRAATAKVVKTKTIGRKGKREGDLTEQYDTALG